MVLVLRSRFAFLVILGFELSFGQRIPYDGKPDDTVFVAGPGLGRGCTYRSGGPLRITIKVDRYIAPSATDGFLSNLSALTRNKVIGTKAKLRMPAFDVDSSNTTSGGFPEVDKVYFNGKELSKTLTGIDNAWSMNEFDVPVEYIKFPSSRPTTGKPTAVDNEIRIDIDTANAATGRESWCTDIDWAELKFDAMAPLLFVHGIAAQKDTWEPAITGYLNSNLIPYERINLVANGAVDTNGKLLSTQALLEANRFGAKHAHLVVHSKGGLDSREYLSKYYDPKSLTILSLATLDTPHWGSVHADISIQQRKYWSDFSSDPDLSAYLSSDQKANAFGAGPKSPGLNDLQTSVRTKYNQDNPFPASVKLFTYGADADLNDDGAISDTEQSPLLDSIGYFPFASSVRSTNATAMYRILRDTSSINVVSVIEDRVINVRGVLIHEPVQKWRIDPVATTTSQENDLSVTTTSAQHPSQTTYTFYDRNHSNIKNEVVMIDVLKQIRRDFAVQ